MKRLFEMKLRNPDEMTKDIRSLYELVCKISSTYSSAVMPNNLYGPHGEPGLSLHGNTDLTLLECSQSILSQCIKDEISISTNVHPLDIVPDGPQHDGCDSVYGMGLFERPNFD